jgi:DNA-binding transcriptional MerR regulator
MSSEALRIGQVAHAAGVNIQTLRYYERSGLFAAPRRNSAGYRQYSADAVRVVTFVKRAQELGFTLREIRDLLRLRSVGPSRRGVVRASAEAKIQDIEKRVRDLTAMRDALAGLVSTCACDTGAVTCPILEALESKSP